MTRLPVRLTLAIITMLACLAAGTVGPSRAGAASSPSAAAQAATRYLLGAQNADGGFGPSVGQPSDPLFTGWAALGLASAGVPVDRLTHGGSSLLAYVLRTGLRSPADLGALERTILVVHAAGGAPGDVAGRNLIAPLRERIRRDGSIGGQVNLTAFGILALRAADAHVPAATVRWLLAQQDADGGFGFAVAGGGSDPDDTGAVLEALAGDPVAGSTRARAIAYLRRQQDRDGGFPSGPGSGSNAQSTAWAVQGLIAAAVSPSAVHRPGGATPLQYLAGMTSAAGLVSYSRGMVQTPVWVSGEVLMALEGRPLPIAPPAGVATTTAPATAPGQPAHTSAHARGRGATTHRAARAAALAASPRGAGSHPPAAAGSAQRELARLEGVLGAMAALALAPMGL
jgi:hypothetical protein